MNFSPNSWWPRAYLGLGEWSLKDPEQLLENVRISQQLLATCFPLEMNSCLRMNCSPNSWWPRAYLGLLEWSLKDSEQLLEDVLLP
jgi:hypothetical protein